MRSWKELQHDLIMAASRGLNTGWARPDRVSINLTLRCNLTCTMCTTCYDSPELSFSEICGIIDQTAEWGVEVFNPLGGEPFMRADLLNIIEYAVRKGFYVTITTNGTLITPSRAQKIASIPNDRLHFNFSLDGDQVCNDQIRGDGMFNKAISGLQLIREADAAAGNPRRKILANTILHAQNLSCFERTLNEQAELGFDGVQILNLFRSEDTDTNNELWFRTEQWAELEELCQRLAKMKKNALFTGYQIQNSLTEILQIPEYYRGALSPMDAPCWAGWKELYINADGQAIMCDGELDFLNGAFGSVREQTLKQLWSSPQLKQRRAVVKRCTTPCVQTCYLREESSSMLSMSRVATGLLHREVRRLGRGIGRPWRKQPDAALVFELSDVSPSDYEGSAIPFARWTQLIRKCHQHPTERNWGKLRDCGDLDFGRGFMGFELLRQVMEDLASRRLHFGSIVLGWRGDPCLHPEWEPIVEYLVHMHHRGVFDRLVITTSGRFCSEQVLRALRQTVPQVWVLDFADGQGECWEALQGAEVQALLHVRVDENTPLNSILDLHPELPIFVGKRPSSGNGWWLTPKERGDFESDHRAEKALNQALHQLNIANIKHVSTKISALISWDGKVTSCHRDHQLNGIIGEVNHHLFSDLWQDVERTQPQSSGRSLCTVCGAPHGPYVSGS